MNPEPFIGEAGRLFGAAPLGVIIVFLYLIIAFCLFMTWWHWRKLWSAGKRQNHLDDGKANENSREPVKPLREINQSVRLLDQPIRLLFHPLRCLLLMLGNADKQRGKSGLRLGDSLVVKNAKIMDARMNIRQKLAPALGVNGCNI